MRILFAGTPEIAVPCLEGLVAAGHSVEVLTNPDAPAGRGGSVVSHPVKARALELGIPVFQPLKLDSEVRSLFLGRFDLLVSFAFGRIFGPLFLGLFPLGGLNVHPSLLPRWRGPSPLAAALLARDPETGISVQRLAQEMDSGDILVRSVRSLDGTETTGTLTAWAAAAAPDLLVAAVRSLGDGTSAPHVQDPSLATYCRLMTKEDGKLTWSDPALEIDARIRACDPWPGTFTSWNGQRLVLKGASVVDGSGGPLPGTVVSVDKSKGILVQTGDGLVAVRELQLPARKCLDFRSFLNGNPSLVGSRLGDPS